MTIPINTPAPQFNLPWTHSKGHKMDYINDVRGIGVYSEGAFDNQQFDSDFLPFIVKAVNCHDELLEALSRIASFQRGGITAADDKDYIIDLAIEAISKARG